MNKKTKKVLLWIVGILVAVFVYIYMKFFQKDKMGGHMSLDSTQPPGSNVLYNGKKVGGWIKPGTLRVVNGYWQGTGSDGGKYSYQESGWVQL